MAKTTSKSRKRQSAKSSRSRSAKSKFQKLRAKFDSAKRTNPHRSFRRSYREDYVRELKVPGLVHHAMDCFKTIFKHWKTFLPLVVLIVILDIFLVGAMSESTYTEFQSAIDDTNLELGGENIGNFAKAGLLLISTITTGGLNQGMSEVQQVFAVIIFLIVWLVTIYLLRHFLAGHQPKLRDGLYNAMTPLISTFCVLAVIFIQLIPIILVVITFSAAISTGFLNTPFYALVYFIFAMLMIILSGYLLSSSLIALVAVTAPGLYPIQALRSASEITFGHRIKLIIRIIYLILVLAVVWTIVMLPLILLDLWLKGIFDWLAGVPFIPLCLLAMTCFSFIYVATYLYLFYRRMLDYEDQ